MKGSAGQLSQLEQGGSMKYSDAKFEKRPLQSKSTCMLKKRSIAITNVRVQVTANMDVII